MRLCPKCGQKNEDIRCPHDGTATLVLTANPESRLAEGTEINGRYRIRKMIGQGGFGAVYRATNIATDQDIAIKLLAVSLDSDDSDQIQRFFAEAQVTASLKHPNTIRVFDFGQTEGGALYIAMELLSGRPLNEILKRRLAEGRVMTEDETITIGTQVLRSLAEAHLAQLVHRDLKPHNVFLHEVEGDDPVVKVLDFGIAKRLGSNMTGTGKAFGTPSYMSPEQAQNQQIDHRSDLYSLACVLYQCVSGKSPFEGDDPLAVLLAHVTKTAPDLRVAAQTPVSEAFVRVLEKAMSKDPADRYATAIEFRQALDQARGRNRTETARSVLPSAAELAASPASSPAAARTTGQTVGYGSPADPRAPHDGRATPPGPGSAHTPASPDERTASYVPPVAASASTGRKPMPAPPRSASSTRLTAQDEDAAPIAPPSGGKKTLAIGAVVAAVVGVVAVLVLEPKPTPTPVVAPEPPQNTAEATKPPVPEPAPPEPVKPAPTPTPPEAAPAPKPAAGPASVVVDSDPAGASVLVAGQPVGKTPATVQVPAEGKVSAVVTLAGHRDLELELTSADAPRKVAKLTPIPGAATRTNTGSKKGGGTAGGSGSGTKKGGGVDLDERLP